MTAPSSRSLSSQADFEVTARTSGGSSRLDSGVDRLGVYKFDYHLSTGVSAYKNTNGKYVIFYDFQTDSWQWIGASDQSVGDGPTLALIPTALDFVEFKGFQWTDVPSLL